MPRSPPVPVGRVNNRLLRALSQPDFDRIVDGFEEVSLDQGLTLIKPSTRIEHVYFPTRGMVSLVQPLADGTMIEVELVGSEGMIGAPLLLGDDRWVIEAMVQMPGTAVRMKRQLFLDAVEAIPEFRNLLLRFTQALLAQLSQSAACNGRHAVDRRLARWLLLARDRADGDELKLSHEFIGMMLGIRRAGVTVALAKLRAAGIVANNYGTIVILDRPALEEAACECYRAIAIESERLLPKLDRSGELESA